MVHWRKRRVLEDQSVDFEAMEELLEELLELFEDDDLDFSKPLKIGFSVSLDNNGSLKINEFGILKEKSFTGDRKGEPFVELIEFEREFLIVVETNSLPIRDIDIKVLGDSMIISSHETGKFLKKVPFPCTVKEDTVKTIYNNSVLEIRVKKREKAAARS